MLGVAKTKISKGWRSFYPWTTGEFIREYLLEHGRAYVYEMWNAYRKKLEEMGVYWGSYDNFRRYIYMLKKLNLIRPVGTETALNPKLHERVYYELVPENVNMIEAWTRPQIILYPETIYGKRKWAKKVEEARAKGLTVRQLALMEHPDILEIRRRLGLE